MTTTAFKMDLIVPCMGMKRLTSQSRTPTTTRTIRTCNKGMDYLPLSRGSCDLPRSADHLGPADVFHPCEQKIRVSSERYLFSCAHIRNPCSFAGQCYDVYATVPISATRRPKATGRKAFNAQDFLDSAGIARKVQEFKRKDTIFSQGDVGNHVLYIQKGGVRL